MRHLRQRNRLDCGVAVAAMISGRPYRDAIEADPDPYAERGIHMTEMALMLRRLTAVKWRITTRGYHRAVGEYPLPAPAAVLIRPQDRRHYHWIATDELGRIHDPELSRAVRPAAYRRRDWLIARILLR